MRAFRPGALPVVILLALAGCGTRYGSVGDRFEAHNTAVADAENRVIALNVVRQAFRAPLQFMLLRTATDTDRFSGTASARFPFGGLLSAPGFLNSSVTANDPHPTLNYEVENTQEFETGISTAVKPSVISRLIDQGLPPELVYTFLVERIDITETTATGEVQRHRCTNEPRAQKQEVFPTKCYGGEMSFDRVLRAMLALGLTPRREKVRVGPPMDDAQLLKYASGEAIFGKSVVQDKKTKKWFVTTTRDVPGFDFHDEKTSLDCTSVGCRTFMAHLEALSKQGNVGEDGTLQAKAGGNSIKLDVSLRSVRGVFAFLGEIAADQLRGDPPLSVRFASSPIIYPKRSPALAFNAAPLRWSITPAMDGTEKIRLSADAAQCNSAPPEFPEALPECRSDALQAQADDPILNRGAIVANAFPHLLFVVCRAADRARVPGNALVTVTYGGQTFYVPSDRGSNNAPICGVTVDLEPLRKDNAETWVPYRLSDNRAGETMQVLLQLLALNRDAEELSQTILTVSTP